MAAPDFSTNPLIPVIAQDDQTGDVLMLAYMNEEAYDETLRTGRVCYYSRGRKRLWRKGEESGHVQNLRRIFYDCDGDTILVRVEQVGDAACHMGFRSCFFTEVDPAQRTSTVIEERVFDPSQVYR